MVKCRIKIRGLRDRRGLMTHNVNNISPPSFVCVFLKSLITNILICEIILIGTFARILICELFSSFRG
jgi:hypothetical protein